MVKASYIKGFMVESIDTNHSTKESCGRDMAFNDALSQMSSRELTLNRERLAKVICDHNHYEGAWDFFNSGEGIRYKDFAQKYKREAHVIHSALPTLLECKETHD